MYISEAFTYCPRCSAKFEKAAEEHLQCPQCGLSYYINPKPCTSLLLQNERGEYLLTQRARAPQKGLWDLPGGFVDEGETFEEGMRRETKEELGIELGDLTYFGSFYDTYDYQGVIYPTLAVTFRAQLSENADLQPADDVASFHFLALADVLLENLAFPSIRQTFERLTSKN